MIDLTDDFSKFLLQLLSLLGAYEKVEISLGCSISEIEARRSHAVPAGQIGAIVTLRRAEEMLGVPLENRLRVIVKKDLVAE